ncbi:hypothetical protein PIB30_078092 [Stylosanthes scabra]|uniref:Uncharacterized protein n=1 Tax=Stylosanthes scabra TaxID=79078 RepID=A0ABU6SSU5_9FABA|nr:hypothetical protein [Stylosanthes scabra]
MGEALVVGGCRPSHAQVGHGTQPLHECRGGRAALVGGGVTWGKPTALGRGEVTPSVPAALVEEGIKTDVETQGDFIKYLIKEVERATFTNIEDVVPFVKWLDDELSYLVDERAVLNHFEWSEQKANALREAAFGFSYLKKLESETSSFCDDPRKPCALAQKKMQALHEKHEHFSELYLFVVI